jgi:hypothetical protein
VDSGVPQASKRAGSRPGGGGVQPPAAKGAAAKSNGAAQKSSGTGSPRPGPVDPRTEDPNSPLGLSRAGKTVSRRPGASTPRTAKHRESGVVEAPIEFSVAARSTPARVESPDAKGPDTVADVVIEAEPTDLVPTIEVRAPSQAPTEPMPQQVRTTVVPIPAPILYDEAATIDDVTQIGPILETRPLHRPVHFRRAPKPRVRRVTRVVRHVDTWSVFKVALVFNVFFYAVAMIAGVLLWQVAYATGTVDNVEKFFEGFGWESFNFNGGQIFHNAWIAGLFVAVGLTGLAVLLATLFNLITDLVGGIRLSVLEEEVRTREERGTAPVVYDDAPMIFGSSETPDAFDVDFDVEALATVLATDSTTTSTDQAIAG